jgi:ribonuclease D
MEYEYIKSSIELNNLLKYLMENKIEKLAIDFESESNLHVYGERLCIIQVYDGNKYFIIDPINIEKGELEKFFENKKVIKYFYGCDSDLSLVYKQYNIKIKAVFDIKNMVNVLKLEKQGLDSVLEEILGIITHNKKYFQMYNWTVRPIKKDALEYALNDVAYLFPLYDELLRRILNENKVQNLLDEIARNKTDFDWKAIPTVYKSNEYKDLRKNEKELFDRIYKIRDEYARELDFPPNNVLTKEVMFNLVKGKIKEENIVVGSKVPYDVKVKILKSISEIM